MANPPDAYLVVDTHSTLADLLVNPEGATATIGRNGAHSVYVPDTGTYERLDAGEELLRIVGYDVSDPDQKLDAAFPKVPNTFDGSFDGWRRTVEPFPGEATETPAKIHPLFISGTSWSRIRTSITRRNPQYSIGKALSPAETWGPNGQLVMDLKTLVADLRTTELREIERYAEFTSSARHLVALGGSSYCGRYFSSPETWKTFVEAIQKHFPQIAPPQDQDRSKPFKSTLPGFANRLANVARMGGVVPFTAYRDFQFEKASSVFEAAAQALLVRHLIDLDRVALLTQPLRQMFRRLPGDESLSPTAMKRARLAMPEELRTTISIEEQRADEARMLAEIEDYESRPVGKKGFRGFGYGQRNRHPVHISRSANRPVDDNDATPASWLASQATIVTEALNRAESLRADLSPDNTMSIRDRLEAERTLRQARRDVLVSLSGPDVDYGAVRDLVVRSFTSNDKSLQASALHATTIKDFLRSCNFRDLEDKDALQGVSREAILQVSAAVAPFEDLTPPVGTYGSPPPPKEPWTI
jgi:hypothetical protein